MEHPKSETALDWFCRQKDPSLCISTSYPWLDELLGGSIPPASVTEIAGDVGAGKYRFAMAIIAELLLSDYKAHYAVSVLNYNQSINERRLAKVLMSRMAGSTVREEDNKRRKAGQLLRRVELCCTYTPDELEEALSTLRSKFSEPDSPIPFVMINSAGAILSETSYDEQEIGNMIQDRILKAMREFCSSTGGTVITLNDVVHWRGAPTAALGRTWIEGVPTRLLLCQNDPNDDESVRRKLYLRLEVKNSRYNGVTVAYALNDEGGFEWEID